MERKKKVGEEGQELKYGSDIVNGRLCCVVDCRLISFDSKCRRFLQLQKHAIREGQLKSKNIVVTMMMHA